MYSLPVAQKMAGNFCICYAQWQKVHIIMSFWDLLIINTKTSQQNCHCIQKKTNNESLCMILSCLLPCFEYLSAPRAAVNLLWRLASSATAPFSSCKWEMRNTGRSPPLFLWGMKCAFEAFSSVSRRILLPLIFPRVPFQGRFGSHAHTGHVWSN